MKSPSLLLLTASLIFAMPCISESSETSFTKKLEQSISSALRFLQSTRSPGTFPYQKGEWKTEAEVHGPALLIAEGLSGEGSGNLIHDPTLFVTASVMNNLEFVSQDARWSVEVADLNRSSLLTLERYRSEGLFHFYPRGAFPKVPELHGPMVLSVRPPLRGVLAVPGDADTTAVANYWLQMNSPVLFSQDAFIQQLTIFRDVKRRSNVYNALHNTKDTGAYLTWFAQEPSVPNPVYSLKSRRLGARIPTGQNDVDCVVNANVLRSLAKGQQSAAPGFAEACRFLNQIAKDQSYDSCGIYYPNTFYFHLAVTHAYQNQVSCLAPAVDQIQKHLLKTQAADGHWATSVGRRDDLHATLMAVNALLNLRRASQDAPKPEVRLAVALGIRWILDQSQLDFATGHLKWQGGIFFSGFPPLRSMIVWRSEAFTTSLAIRALHEYLISGVQREAP